jgi:circadian clock protein KaiB
LTIRSVREEHPQGHHALEVADFHVQPVLSLGEQIVSVPTLIKQLLDPLRQLLRDMPDTQKILQGLDLRPEDGKQTQRAKAKAEDKA